MMILLAIVLNGFFIVTVSPNKEYYLLKYAPLALRILIISELNQAACGTLGLYGIYYIHFAFKNSGKDYCIFHVLIVPDLLKL